MQLLDSSCQDAPSDVAGLDGSTVMDRAIATTTPPQITMRTFVRMRSISLQRCCKTTDRPATADPARRRAAGGWRKMRVTALLCLRFSVPPRSSFATSATLFPAFASVASSFPSPPSPSVPAALRVLRSCSSAHPPFTSKVNPGMRTRFGRTGWQVSKSVTACGAGAVNGTERNTNRCALHRAIDLDASSSTPHLRRYGQGENLGNSSDGHDRALHGAPAYVAATGSPPKNMRVAGRGRTTRARARTPTPASRIPRVTPEKSRRRTSAAGRRRCRSAAASRLERRSGRGAGDGWQRGGRLDSLRTSGRRAGRWASASTAGHWVPA